MTYNIHSNMHQNMSIYHIKKNSWSSITSALFDSVIILNYINSNAYTLYYVSCHRNNKI